MDQTDPPVAPAPYPLLGMLAFLALTNVGMMVVTHWLIPPREGWGMFGGWLLNLVVIFGAFAICNRGNESWLLLAIPFAIFALAYGVIGGHIPRAFRVRESPVIPVAEAEKQSYDVYRFSDARVETKQIEHLTFHGRGGLYYYAAPIVGPGWKAGDHVPAWVVHSTINPGYPASWDQDLRGGYVTGFDERYRELIDKAARSKTTPTSANAPVLIWSEDPKKGFMAAAWWELGFLLAIDLAGIVMVLWPTPKT